MTCSSYDNKLTIDQGDTKSFYCSIVSADVSDWSLYTGHFEVKKDFYDENFIIDTSALCVDSSMWIFNLTSNDTSTAGNYNYQFYVQYGSIIKTVVQDKMVINDSIRV